MTPACHPPSDAGVGGRAGRAVAAVCSSSSLPVPQLSVAGFCGLADTQWCMHCTFLCRRLSDDLQPKCLTITHAAACIGKGTVKSPVLFFSNSIPCSKTSLGRPNSTSSGARAATTTSAKPSPATQRSAGRKASSCARAVITKVRDCECLCLKESARAHVD